MTNPKLDFNNDAFFSDAVSIDVDVQFVKELPGKAFTLEAYKEQMLRHLEEVGKVIAAAENDGLKNLYLQFTHEYEVSASAEEKFLKLHLIGTKPWSSKKIEEFNQAVKQEKDEISQLKELIKKYPEKALFICNNLK